MNDINVDKSKLISVLNINLVKHREDFKETMEEYNQAFSLDLKKMAKRHKAGEPSGLVEFNAKFSRKPVSHEKAYTLAIGALAWSVDDVIALNFHDFDKYINDNWEWKQQYDLTKSLYRKTL